MNYKFLLVLIILFGVISCKEKSKSQATLIPLTVTSTETVSIKLSQIINIGTLNIQNKTATIDKDNPFIIQQIPNKLTMCTLLAKDTMAIFFIGPNKECKISIRRNKNNKISFDFNQDDYLNNFTNNFHKQLSPLMRSNLNEKPLLEFIGKTESNVLSQLQQLKPHLDNVSYKLLTSMVTGKITHVKYMQSERFTSLTSNSSYFDFADAYTFDDDNYLTYSDNLNTVLDVLRTQYERKYNISFDKTSYDKFNFINNSLKNKEVKSAIICFLATQIIPEQNENKKEELLIQISQFSLESNYLQHIKNTKASTAIGKKFGNKAKYLETLISYDNEFKINQLEGKTVYIDNWATWCGPCMKSMKAFKEKQQVLNTFDDIIFIFVSFDRNENIWRNYVKKSLVPNQNVIHLYNGMEMNSKYGKYYNISGLPSYLVVDKQGLIYDIKPKTPSDKNFEDYIKQL